MRSRGRWCWLLLLVACGSTQPPSSATPPAAQDGPPSPIVAAERGRRGGHLVFVGEDGNWAADLTGDGEVPVYDGGASWSPDGRYVVFESSRGRDQVTQTSLWIVAARPGGRLRRLTSGAGLDRDPAWQPDGSGVVFASNRAGTFDLYRLDLEFTDDGVREAGAPVRLTDAASREIHPSVSPSGAVVYAAADPATGSSLWILEPGAAPRQLTPGPADLTPSFSPDGTLIAFTAGVEKRIESGGEVAIHVDTDLFLIRPDGSDRQQVIDEPFADQHGPRWSRDGRYLFATSVYRAVASHQAVAASLTFVDLGEKPMVTRTLIDPVTIETLDAENFVSRMSPTLAPVTLHATALHANPTYSDVMHRFGENLERMLRARQQRDRAESPARAP